MTEKNGVINLANQLILELKTHGFLVGLTKSKTTNSIYLEIDNGLIGSVRVSDHKVCELNPCEYVIMTSRGTTHLSNGRMIYYANNVDALIYIFISKRKKMIINCGGIKKYKEMMKQ